MLTAYRLSIQAGAGYGRFFPTKAAAEAEAQKPAFLFSYTEGSQFHSWFGHKPAYRTMDEADMVAWMAADGYVFDGPLQLDHIYDHVLNLGIKIHRPGIVTRGTCAVASIEYEAADLSDLQLRD